MKPKPLVELKNFTVPFAILNSFQFARLKYSELPFAADFYEFERNTEGALSAPQHSRTKSIS
ncbi:unnamed protein product [Brucella canis str. Oliveri]|nr:unnamed protein product [Brucella canis str. Oliveri]